MKNKLKKSIFTLIALLITICVSGCTFDKNILTQISPQHSNVNMELVPQDGKNGTNGIDGKDGADGNNINLYEIYEKLVELNQFSGEYSDFVKEYLGDQQNSTLATNKALNSVVSIYSGFSSTITYYTSPITVKQFESKSYGAGSGVIFRLDKSTGDALIITNYHVVYDGETNSISDEISLLCYGNEDFSISSLNSVKDYYGREYVYSQFQSDASIPATYLGGSLLYDIAVLKVSGSEILKQNSSVAANFADSDKITVGETAIAIGNPSGAGISATRGIISVDSEYISLIGADNRTPCTYRVLRTDTAVNAGNSGGGLFDSSGNLIGIVNAKIASATIENIGYAIPANIAQNVAKNIIKNCDGQGNTTIKRCMLGISVEAISSSAKFDGTKTTIEEVVAIGDITSGSVAANKFDVGDILKSVTVLYSNGNSITKSITRTFSLVDLSLTLSVGDTITISRTDKDGNPKTDVSITFTDAEVQEFA